KNLFLSDSAPKNEHNKQGIDNETTNKANNPFNRTSPKKDSSVPVRQKDIFLNKPENSGIAANGGERDEVPLSDSFCQAFFLKKRNEEKQFLNEQSSPKTNNVPSSNQHKNTLNNFFDQYKGTKRYRVRTTKFKINITPPKKKLDKDKKGNEEDTKPP
ncbi:MAG: hypothetical protein AB7V50_09780, partial [Vampirovibrionia bacterium]